MTRLILLRHGRTSWNAERRFQGQADPPLDEVGRAQAFEVAALVAALNPDRLVSSDLARARQTATIVAAAVGLEVEVDERLRERSLGHWEGLTREDVEQRYPAEFAEWVAGRDVLNRGGETRDEVAERAAAALGDQPEVGTLVVVTHSATAMAVCNHVLGIPQRQHSLGPLANCHWSELTQEGGTWRLRAHNVGPAGPVVPLPLRVEARSDGLAVDEAPDAEA
jgi:probable phosphoglycerate mutase